MATSVDTVFHGLAAGKTFTPALLRSGLASRANIANDPVTKLRARQGILPMPGLCLWVQQQGTPNMTVSVSSGTVVQVSADSPSGVYTHSLPSIANIDIAEANASNPRLDVIVASVFDDGLSPVTRIERLTGTPAPSPALPTALTTPPTNTTYFPLAQVRVEAGATSITNSKISQPSVPALGLTMGQFTAAPGGTIRGVPRKWSHTRNTTTTFTAGAAAGAVNQVTIPAADCAGGVYQATFDVMLQMTGTPDSATSVLLISGVTPQGSFTHPIDMKAGRFFSWTETRSIVIDRQPSTDQVWQTKLAVGAGSLNANVGAAAYPCTLEVVRISDL